MSWLWRHAAMHQFKKNVKVARCCCQYRQAALQTAKNKKKVKLACQNDLSHHYQQMRVYLQMCREQTYFATLLQGSAKKILQIARFHVMFNVLSVLLQPAEWLSQKAGPKVQPQRFLRCKWTAKDQTVDRQHWHASHCSNHKCLNSIAAAYAWWLDKLSCSLISSETWH